jgi:SAM-dependent methyltransferase
MKAVRQPDYSTVTERPGQMASREQLEMLATRYQWAARHAAGKDVLETACGAGMGLAMLARVARSVDAGDVDAANLAAAREACRGLSKVRVERFNALALPFEAESYDLVLLFEAIYYLHDAEQFLHEARRVLRPGGRLLITTVNREWSGWNPSPFHTAYYSAGELRARLEKWGFSTTLYAGFPEAEGLGAALLGGVRRLAAGLGLIPRTMQGKAGLKRVFQGPLAPVPTALESGQIPVKLLVSLGPGADVRRYRVLYAEARKERV